MTIHLSRKHPLTIEPEVSSTTTLLKKGLNCLRRGQFSEAIAHLTFARQECSPDLTHLAVVLDACIQHIVTYQQAQQALLQASEQMIKAHTDYQSRITSLEKLLFILLNDNIKNTHLALGYTEEHQMPYVVQSLPFEDTPPSFISPISNIQQVSLLKHHPRTEEKKILPDLYFICFGHFEVKRMDQTISLCPNRNGQRILRYLVAQPEHRGSKDTFMAMLWPEDEPKVAHHKLQVATSALRRALNVGHTDNTGVGYILCKQGIYQFNPAISIHTDVEEFLLSYQAGQENVDNTMVTHYENACRLYKGSFMTEDLYVDWPTIQREQLSQAYMAMCRALSEHYLQTGSYEKAIHWASAILKENRCDESAHQQLIRIYVATNRRSEALRQYQRCEHVLAEELGVKPMPDTLRLFDPLR